MLKLDLDRFLNHPGKHFPIDLCLKIEETFSLSEDFSLLEALEVSGEAFFQLNTIYLAIQICTVVEQPCRRCLAPVRTPVDCYEHFSVSLPEGEDSIDLTSEVVGLISASIDPRPLCRPDCRGLCPHCGINLNEHPDHTCQTEEDDHPKLGDFLR
jgi:uncharacterized protein